MKIADRIDKLGTETGKILAILKERRDTAVGMLNAIDGVHCFRPNATFYLYPNVSGVMHQKGFDNYEEFRRSVLNATGVSFCIRRHFGRPLDSEENFYIRFAYSGIDVDQIKEGLSKFKAFVE